jgi:hypothetical protein
MNAAGLLHFDSHSTNVLTDGRRFYLTDFGLAAADRFELDAAERRFVAEHVDHDRAYTATHLVAWLVAGLLGRYERPARLAYIRRCADGGDPTGLPPGVAAVVRRYAPVAAVVGGFYAELFEGNRTAPYPAADVHRACLATGLLPG